METGKSEKTTKIIKIVIQAAINVLSVVLGISLESFMNISSIL